jgi:hypothetical protein
MALLLGDRSDKLSCIWLYDGADYGNNPMFIVLPWYSEFTKACCPPDKDFFDFRLLEFNFLRCDGSAVKGW